MAEEKTTIAIPKGTLVTIVVAVLAGPTMTNKGVEQAAAAFGYVPAAEQAVAEATSSVNERLEALEMRFNDPETWERQKAEVAASCAGAIVAQILPAPPPAPRPDDALPPQ